MNKFKIGLICFLAGSLITGILSVYLVKKYWPTEIEIMDIHTDQTQYNKPEIITKPENTPANYDYFYKCTLSPIATEITIKDNIIYGRAFDDCKSAEFTVKLKPVQALKHTLQAAYIFQMDIGSSIEISYFYNLNLFSIGGGLILNKNYPGIKISIQRSF